MAKYFNMAALKMQNRILISSLQKSKNLPFSKNKTIVVNYGNFSERIDLLVFICQVFPWKRNLHFRYRMQERSNYDQTARHVQGIDSCSFSYQSSLSIFKTIPGYRPTMDGSPKKTSFPSPNAFTNPIDSIFESKNEKKLTFPQSDRAFDEIDASCFQEHVHSPGWLRHQIVIKL